MIVENIFTHVCLNKIEGMEDKEKYIKELKELVVRGK
jgi:hypothetical protein